MVTIATTIQNVLKHLDYTTASQSLEKYQAEVVRDLWFNELGRLRVWTANLGAHRTGQSSLDFRLREASHLKDQILRVLGRLHRTIQDLEALLRDAGLHEEYSSDSDDTEDEDQTEIQRIYRALHDTISILFEDAVAIRRPAHHDRLLGVKRSDTVGFELWDRKHVADKFPGLNPDIRDRLGLAISQRRAILKYRERHNLKLAQGLDLVEYTELSETVATELVMIPAEDKSELRSTSSQTSYAKTIVNGREGMGVPPLPQGSPNKDPFECPYCFLLIQVDNRQSWAQHVFHDLMPYVCVFPNCQTPHRLFESRREWYTHLQRDHAVPNETGSPIPCPLCSMSVSSGKPFQRHLGRHLQELALFALPRYSPDEDNESNVSTKPENIQKGKKQRFESDLDGLAWTFDIEESLEHGGGGGGMNAEDSFSHYAQETVDHEQRFESDLDRLSWKIDIEDSLVHRSGGGGMSAEEWFSHYAQETVDHKQRFESDLDNLSWGIDIEDSLVHHGGGGGMNAENSFSHYAQEAVDHEQSIGIERDGPFKCESSKCGYEDTFTTAAKLKLHAQKQHLAESLFKCLTCGYNTNQKSDLKHHMLAVHVNVIGQQKMFDTDLTGVMRDIPEDASIENFNNEQEPDTLAHSEETRLETQGTVSSNLDMKLGEPEESAKSEHRPNMHHEMAEPHENTDSRFSPEPLVALQKTDVNSTHPLQQPARHQRRGPSRRILEAMERSLDLSMDATPQPDPSRDI